MAIWCSTTENSFLRQISTGEGYSSTSLLPCQYHSISVPHSHFIHQPTTLYHLKDQQRRNILNISPSFPQLPPNIQVRPPTISYVKQFISYILSQTVIWLCNEVCSVIHTQNGGSNIKINMLYVSNLEAFLETNRPSISLHLAPWISSLPEKPIGPQSKEFPHFIDPQK